METTMPTYLIDGATQLPETGATGWGTTLNAAIAAIDARFTWTGTQAVANQIAASGITGTTLPVTLVTSSLTSVGTLTSLAVSGSATVSGNATVAGLLTGATTFALINTTATTVNFAGAATALNIGAGTGTTTVNNALVVTGNLTVNGTTTTVNSTTLTVDDKNIVLADTASPTDVGADGGGITLKGTTDKTFNWVDSTDAWTSSEHLGLAAGKAFYIGGTGVLSSTTLGSGVTNSTLTSVGTISSGVWNGTAVAGQYGGTGVANTGKTITVSGNTTIGSSTHTVAFTTSADTALALPTTGTLVNDAVTSLASLATVGTITSGTWNGSVIDGARGGTGVANTGKTITLGGNLTTSGAFATTFIATATTSLTLPTTGTLATTADTHYIGTTAVTLSRASSDLALTGISSITLPGSSTGSAQIIASAAAGTGTVITLPSASGTVVTTGDTGSVTSAMISNGTIVDADINSAAAIAASKISGTAVTQADTGTVTNTMLAGSIADTKLSTIATAGKVSNSATTAASANTASAIVARDASGDFTAGTITAALSGNAATATKLATARTINGVSFDGSANVTIGFATIDDIGDVSVAGVTTGEFLKWNGTAWINASVNYGAIASLTEIGDVLITSAASGDFLRWNGTKWINDAVDLGTDTVGSYVASLVAGSGITLSNNSGEGATPTVTVDTTVIQARISGVTDTEIGYLDGVTSAIQTQFDAKAPLASPTLTGTPIAPTAAPGTNNTQIATTAYADAAVAAIVDSAPGALNTLNELAAAINDDASYAATITTALGLKAPLADPTFTGTVTLPDNTVALGTKTTGDYVSSLVAGTGVTLSNNTGESATPTIAIGQAVGTASNVQFNNITATGTVTITGETIIGPATIVNKTAGYTLALADQGKIVEMNIGSAVQVTVPPNTDVAFPIGTQINVMQYGAGKVQVAQGAGVVVRGTPGLYLRAQYSSATLIKRATDEWYLIGDLSAS